VRETLGVATQCGKCACLAKQVVRDTLTQVQTAQASSLSHPVEFTPA
jgi:bacterioferritin-associated ferredoxin